MKIKNRTYRVMIIPENGNKTVSFQLSKTVIYIVTISLLCSFIVSGFLLYKAVVMARKHHYYNTLQNENKRLTQENNQLSKAYQKVVYLDSIATYLEQLSTLSQTQTKVKEFAIAESVVPVKKKAVTAVPADSGSGSKTIFLPVKGWITQSFKMDTTQGSGSHPGIDIAAPQGTDIKASAPGVVIAVLQDSDYGTMVVVQHEKDFVTRYGHCAQTMVSINDSVEKGQTIAKVGNTGRSSAPHLHYEVLKNGMNVDPLRNIPIPSKQANLRSNNG